MQSLSRILGFLGAIALAIPPYSLGPADSLVMVFAGCSIVGGVLVAGALQGFASKYLTLMPAL